MANGVPVLDSCIGVLAVRSGVGHAPISPITLSLTKGNVRDYYTFVGAIVKESVLTLSDKSSLKIRRY